MSLAAEQLEPSMLATARYGKVKWQGPRAALCAVHDPENEVHDVLEYNVTVLLKGAIETRSAHIANLPARPMSSLTEIYFVASPAIRKGTIAS